MDTENPTGSQPGPVETRAEAEAAAPRTSDLAFKVCVVALWSDGSMAASERDHLSHLIDSLAADEAERDALRRTALHDVDRRAVLAEIADLGQDERLDLFDRSVAVLTSDRRVRRGELGFLRQLRRSCGVGFWRFERLVWRLGWRRRAAALAGLVTLGVLAVLPWGAREQGGAPPLELSRRAALALAPLPLVRSSLDPEALYETVRRSVVQVNVLVEGGYHGNGSGSVVAIDRFGQLYVLTNRHVVYHELSEGRRLSYEVQLESGVKLPALLDFYSRRWDLALLVVPRLTGWARPVPLLPRSELRVGQRVYAVGSPLGLDHTFTSGVISAIRDDFIQTDATVHSGSSGGPLFDGSGLVCGVVTTTHQHKDLSFALAADTVLDMLAERDSEAPG